MATMNQTIIAHVKTRICQLIREKVEDCAEQKAMVVAQEQARAHGEQRSKFFDGDLSPEDVKDRLKKVGLVWVGYAPRTEPFRTVAQQAKIDALDKEAEKLDARVAAASKALALRSREITRAGEKVIDLALLGTDYAEVLKAIQTFAESD